MKEEVFAEHFEDYLIEFQNRLGEARQQEIDKLKKLVREG